MTADEILRLYASQNEQAMGLPRHPMRYGSSGWLAMTSGEDGNKKPRLLTGVFLTTGQRKESLRPEF